MRINIIYFPILLTRGYKDTILKQITKSNLVINSNINQFNI